MANELIELTKNSKNVLVDNKQFSHIRRKFADKILRLTFSSGEHLLCTKTHRIKMSGSEFEFAEDLNVGAIFSTGLSLTSIENIDYNNWVYDIVGIENCEYETHGVISHNCIFLSSDALLINSMKLQQLKYSRPSFEDMGFKFWADPNTLGGHGKTYLVSLDPATGNGKDFSVIQIFDFPKLTQIAEWRSNEINIPLLYAKLKWVLNKLTMPVGRGRAEVLWTFERNGIGEAMSALYVNDEKPPEFAELYNDAPGKYGVYTSGKSKILSCLQLKTLIEKVNNGFTINSEILLFELKNFVAKGGSYEAKSGCTDDCVMATVGITRLIKRLAEYNDEAFKRVNEYVEANDPTDDEPLGMVF